MTNKSKNTGTKFETDSANYLKGRGFVKARREVLHGSLDQGDLVVAPGLIAECKGGLAAENASDHQLRLWYQETMKEKVNAGATHAFLIVKRKGHGVQKAGGWYVVQNEGGMLIKFRLDEYVTFLTSLGWTKDGLNAEGLDRE